MSYNYLGFHGTTRENADSIIDTKRFTPSLDDEEWLGEGVYFFENDIKQAYYFCTKARCYKEWAILKSKIEVKTVIDLTLLDHVEEFKRIADHIKNRHQKRKDGKTKKLLNGVILNIMYKAEKYDIVRGIFEVPKMQAASRTTVVPMQIQLCVRNKACIKTIEEVEYCGHKAV